MIFVSITIYINCYAEFAVRYFELQIQHLYTQKFGNGQFPTFNPVKVLYYLHKAQSRMFHLL